MWPTVRGGQHCVNVRAVAFLRAASAGIGRAWQRLAREIPHWVGLPFRLLRTLGQGLLSRLTTWLARPRSGCKAITGVALFALFAPALAPFAYVQGGPTEPPGTYPGEKAGDHRRPRFQSSIRA
jgi:hypothetical protein